MTVSLDTFKRTLARVLDRRGQVQGSGLLVPRHVLTCAAVAGHALDVAQAGASARDKEPGTALSIELPFVDGEVGEGRAARIVSIPTGKFALGAEPEWTNSSIYSNRTIPCIYPGYRTPER